MISVLAVAAALWTAQPAEPAAGPADPFGPEPLFLTDVKLERASTQPFDPGRGHRITVFYRGDGSGLDEFFERHGVKPSTLPHVAVDVAGYPSEKAKAEPWHTQPSFLIDYDEPPVQKVRELFVAEKRPQTVEEVTRFVRGYIARKNLKRGYDIASVVARRREGDCTEHAVLLAALARSLGLPARVVHGVVLVEEKGRVIAAGHAWVEHLRDGRWRPADAALLEESKRLYLPMTVIDDEGPGFGMAIAKGGILFVERVKLEDAT